MSNNKTISRGVTNTLVTIVRCTKKHWSTDQLIRSHLFWSDPICLPFLPLVGVIRRLVECALITLKPIFHSKLSAHWLTNANERDTNNMKSTWQTPAPHVGDPTPPIFHLLVLGVCVGGNTNFSVCVGVTPILAFLDTHMLVSPMRNCGVGGLSQHFQHQ